MFVVMRKYYNVLRRTTTYHDGPRPRSAHGSSRNSRGTPARNTTYYDVLRRMMTYYNVLRRTTPAERPRKRPRKLACHCDGPLPAKPPRELLLHLRCFLLPLKRRLLRLLSGQSIDSFLRGLPSIQDSIGIFQICVSVTVP